MSDYRLYIIGADGHIGKAVDMECPGDAAALATAASFENEHGLELWQGARKVKTLMPLAQRVLPPSRIGKLRVRTA